MDYKALQEAQDLVSKAPISDEDKKPIKAKLDRAALPSPLDTDKWIYRMVVGALGLAILGCLTFSFVLVLLRAGGATGGEVKIPEIFLAISSAAIGALAGLLAPSPGSRSQG